MDFHATILTLFVFLFAAVLKGITGLGFSTICLAFLALFMEPKISIPLVLIPSLLSNLLAMNHLEHVSSALKRFWLVYAAAVPGLILGVSTFHVVDRSVSRGLLGLILILYAIANFRERTLRTPENVEAWLRVPVGFCTGFVNGITGSQVLPVLPFMLSLHLKTEIFVQAINLSFTISSLLLLVLFNRYDLMSGSLVTISLLGIVPVSIGIFIGGKIRQFLPEPDYRRAVLFFLLIIGVALIFARV